MFQSLIGRLKTALGGLCRATAFGMFQSLIGRLKTRPDAQQLAHPRAFQSLIGRLKTAKPNAQAPRKPSFQSLIGRLKTRERERAREQGVGCFNPS